VEARVLDERHAFFRRKRAQRLESRVLGVRLVCGWCVGGSKCRVFDRARGAHVPQDIAAARV
jgi:hypothetical protein